MAAGQIPSIFASFTQTISASGGALLGLLFGTWWAALDLLWLCTSRRGLKQLIYGDRSQQPKPSQRGSSIAGGSNFRASGVSSRGSQSSPQQAGQSRPGVYGAAQSSANQAVQYASSALSSAATSALQASAQAVKTTAATVRSAEATPAGKKATQVVSSAGQYATGTYDKVKATPAGQKASQAAASAGQVAQNVYDSAKATSLGQKASHLASQVTRYAQEAYDGALTSPAGQQVRQAASEGDTQARVAYARADGTPAQLKASQASSQVSAAAQDTYANVAATTVGQDVLQAGELTSQYTQDAFNSTGYLSQRTQAGLIRGSPPHVGPADSSFAPAMTNGYHEHSQSSSAPQGPLVSTQPLSKDSPATSAGDAEPASAGAQAVRLAEAAVSRVQANATQAMSHPGQYAQDTYEYAEVNATQAARHPQQYAQETLDSIRGTPGGAKASELAADAGQNVQNAFHDAKATPAGQKASQAASEAGQYAQNAYEGAKATPAGQHASQAVSHAGQFAQDAYDGASKQASQAASHPGQYAQETVDTTKANVNQAINQPGEYIQDSYEAAKATSSGQQIGQAASQVGQTAQEMYQTGMATSAGAEASQIGTQAYDAAVQTAAPVADTAQGALNQAGSSSTWTQGQNRMDEPPSPARPTYNFQATTTTRAGRIDSPQASQAPPPDFFPPSYTQEQGGFSPSMDQAAFTAHSTPVEAPSTIMTNFYQPAPEYIFGSTYGAETTPPPSFAAPPPTIPSQSFQAPPASEPTAGTMPPLQAGSMNVQPAPGLSGMVGMVAASSGSGIQVAPEVQRSAPMASGNGQQVASGTQPIIGGQVVGGSSHAPQAGGAPGAALVVAPEGRGPAVKPGRLSPDAAAFQPSPIKTASGGSEKPTLTSFPVSGVGSEYTTPSSSPIGAQHEAFFDGASSSQAYSRGTDDEDHLSQGTSPSYSSVAPLGLPAGDAGGTQAGAQKEKKGFRKTLKTSFNKLTGKAGKQDREDPTDPLDHSKSQARKMPGPQGYQPHRR